MEALVVASFDEARAHGHAWVGAEHLLLALSKEPSGSPAREALSACGISEASIAKLLSKLSAGSSTRTGVSPNPRFWDAHGPQTALFNDLGASSTALQAALAAQGVAVPDAEPPPFDNTKWGERVSILRREYDEGLPGRIARLLPKGTQFGCNALGDDAWVIAEEGVELAPYIEQARRPAASD